MSLLIKALDKAESDKVDASGKKPIEKNKPKEAGKSDAADLELSLSPVGSQIAQTASKTEADKAANPVSKQTSHAMPTVSSTGASTTGTSKSAANVFSAKGVEATNRNTTMALIAGAGLIGLLGLGLYYYQFVGSVPEVVIPPRPPEPIQAQIQEDTQTQAPERLPEQLENVATAQPEAPPVPEQSAANSVFESNEPTRLLEAMSAKKPTKKPVIANKEALVEPESSDEFVEPPAENAKPSRKSTKLHMGEAIASPSASINVSKSKSEAGVNPILMSAYQAYSAGNDADAQKLYKQVLRQDVRNVDALLGLGAIAARQGRNADANGWYGKVLEVDPRNNIALAALLESQPQGNEANTETRIKNMLAKNPSDANLHVALGNLYAEQNQWPAAQQAYFDAYSLNGNADNAFNLAVSLDQMGKPKLALPYYQRALDLAQTNPNGIDKAALEARIAAIQ